MLRRKGLDGREARQELKPKKGKWTWVNPSKETWNKGEERCWTFYPLEIPHNPDTLHVFEGVWDYLKGIEDGLCATSGIYGALALPRSQDIWILRAFRRVVIHYDMDKAGYKGREKLASYLAENCPAAMTFRFRSTYKPLIFSQFG